MSVNGTGRPVELTAHPLQRIGAYALAALADVPDVESLTAEDFDKATRTMAAHVAATADVEDAKSPGGFWLGVSYLLWPNSAMNTTNRKDLSRQERRERIMAWRNYPTALIDVPCALCGRTACGFYGKVDVPLGASILHRNTTAPDHDGLPLCVGCLASFHALPYGCAIGGGRAAALHSWDDNFLEDTVGMRVHRIRLKGVAAMSVGGSGAYAREVAALRRLRSYEDDIQAPVELYVFSNSNREQVLDVHSLQQPLAEWLRTTMRNPERRTGFGYLVRAHWSEKISGPAWLARNAFRYPPQVARQAIDYLAGFAHESGAPAPETGALADLCFSYVIEVLQMNERDVDRVKDLAGRIARVLAATPEDTEFKKYVFAHREQKRLRSWLSRQDIQWTLFPPDPADVGVPFITAEQWRLLFEPDGQGWFTRDLLLVSVLQGLSQQGWRAEFAGDPDARRHMDDDELISEEDQ